MRQKIVFMRKRACSLSVSERSVNMATDTLAGPDDRVLPFTVETLDVRGRTARLGPVVDTILTGHAYPDIVSELLGQAVTLAVLLGSALKFEGRFQLQTRTDGPVGMVVVDFEAPDRVRGYANYERERLVEGLTLLADRGHRLSICSNKPQNLVDKVLEDTGLAPLFNSVVGGRAGVAPKPAPDLLDLVLDDLGAAPGECLFVGDSELDHAVADARGLPFLFLTHGYADPDYQPDPAMSYECFGKLAEAVLERAHG
jgi:phosphoglycolate phosphatase-like HAD superfamily hydrolase